jgi:hypothetical protein
MVRLGEERARYFIFDCHRHKIWRQHVIGKFLARYRYSSCSFLLVLFFMFWSQAEEPVLLNVVGPSGSPIGLQWFERKAPKLVSAPDAMNPSARTHDELYLQTRTYSGARAQWLMFSSREDGCVVLVV